MSAAAVPPSRSTADDPGGSTTRPQPPTSVQPTVVPSASAPAVLGPDAADALQRLLAGEHAAVWAYGVLGPRAAGDQAELARAKLLEHSRTRDDVRALLADAGLQPTAGQPAYRLPIEPVDPTTAGALAALVEHRLGGLYADLVGAADERRLRSFGVRGLLTTTRAVVTWGGSVAAFPGLAERSVESPTVTGPTGATTGTPSTAPAAG